MRAERRPEAASAWWQRTASAHCSTQHSALSTQHLPGLRRGRRALFVALTVALVAAVLAGTAWGSVRIPVGVIARMIALRLHLPGAGMATWPASWETIVFTIRLPRVILAALVGASLSVAGATYQGLFRNPLAEPYLIGVASGAALGATLSLVVSLPLVLYRYGVTQWCAFAGALIAVVAVYGLARV